MKKLIEKSNNEKYYQTIKYFYHKLTDDKKSQFITQVAEKNILLASQCLMTDKKNEEIESKIKKIALSHVQSFSDTNQSTLSLLALAEFELYDTILSLINTIDRPNKIIISVLNQVFFQADEVTYIKLMSIFVKSNNIGHFFNNFVSYKGTVSINTSNIKILKEFVDKLIEENYSGFLKTYFDTYNLWDSAEIIMSENLDNLIENLLTKNFRATRLAFYIVQNTNRSDKYSVELFIESFSKYTSNKNAMFFALELALNNNIYNNEILSNSILKYILESISKSTKRKKIKVLIEKGLDVLLSNNLFLNNKLNDILFSLENDDDIIKTKEYAFIDSFSYNEDYNSNLEQLYQSVFTGIIELRSISYHYTLYEFFDKIFSYLRNNITNVYLEQIIDDVVDLYFLNAKEIFYYLKSFPQEGIIRQVEDYGMYIESTSFPSKNLCYLDLKAFSVSDYKKFTNLNHIGKKVEITIVGITVENKRLKIKL